MDAVGLIVLWCALGGGIGYAIGRAKDRPEAGLLLGLFLGVVGWIIAAVLPSPSTVARRAGTTATDPKPAAAPPRATTTPAPAKPERLQPRADLTLAPAVQAQFDAMLAAAANEPDADALRGAVTTLARSGRVVRPMHSWAFVEGTYCLAVKHDGVVQLVDRLMNWRACPSGSPTSAAEDADGEITQLWIGDRVLGKLRPKAQARAFVAAVNATIRPTPSVTATLPADHADDHTPASTAPPTPEPVTAASGSTVTEALHELEKIRAAGLISDAEYTTKRAEVLGRL